MCHSHDSTKHLYRSATNRTMSGIFGGPGEYFGVDPTVLRLLFVFFLVMTGVFPGVFLYIIAILIVPEAPSKQDVILDDK